MASTKSLSPFIRSLTRSQQTPYICGPCLQAQQPKSRAQAQRSLHRSVKPLPVPQPTPFVPDVQTFLTLIGRGLSQHAGKFQNWASLFTKTSTELKDLGIEPTRTRRYLLRWRQKFRLGDFGVGGDFTHVENGTATLRVCEVPRLEEDKKSEFLSTVQTPGMTKLILNVPSSSQTYVLKAGQKVSELKKPQGYKLGDGGVIKGSWAVPVKGTNGSVAVVKVTEGMWEDRLGKKVFGGERRRAQVLHKMGVEEYRKNK